MSFDNLKLEKGLYTTGKSFTNALEELDPSENYIGTELEGLDAYQRQLKRFDIKVSGIGSDPVSKFFSTSDSAALFPEYVSRAVKQGLTDANIVDDLVATTTVVDSLDYRAIESVNTNAVDDEGYIGEGSFIPESIIKTKETLTPLHKRGKMLVASYEAIKSQKLDVFTVALKQIGEYIAGCQLLDLLNLLTSDESRYVDRIKAGETSYDDLLNLWGKFNPYNMDRIILNTETMTELLKMPEFKDSRAGQTFHGTGDMITPFGAKIVRAPSCFDADSIIGIDKNYAVEKVQFGDIVTDFDKLIDRQLERATVTSTVGFSTIFDDACRVLA